MALDDLMRELQRLRARLSSLEQADRALARQLDLEHTVAAVSARLVGAQDLDAAIEAALADLGRASDADRAYMFLIHEDRSVMDNTHEWCAPGVLSERENLQGLPLEDFPWWMARLRAGGALHIPDVSQLPREAASERQILQAQHIKSLLVFPLWTGGGLAGFIGFDNVREAGGWSPESFGLLQTASDLIGSALSRARSEASIHASHEQIANILESITDGFFALDHRWRFTYVNREAERLLQRERGDLLGRTVREAFPNGSGLAFYLKYRQAVATRTAAHFEAYYEPMDAWFEVHAYPGRDGLSVYFHDATERRRAEDALRRREKAFRTLAEHAPDIIVRLDRALRVVYVNPAIEPVVGKAPEAIIGKALEEMVIPQDLADSWGAVLTDVLCTGEERTVEFDAPTLLGGRSYQARIVPEFGPDGTAETVLAIVRDLTERRRVEQLKDEFLGLVSHELRTPTTTILGGTHLLERYGEHLDPQTQDTLIQDIKTEAQRLERLINDLLDLAKLQAGATITAEPVHIGHVLATVVEELAREEASHTLVLRVPPSLPIVEAERAYVEQVTRNLVGNARKFAPAGTEIVVTAESEGGEVVIGVLDRGPGVPAAERERIFEPFYRREATAERAEGAGLGLALAKRLVETFSGRIWVEDRPGGGAAFRFTLPVISDAQL